MPYLMIVLDGLEDSEYPELNGKTPYEWGKSESFIEIESACARGKLATTPDGFEPDTQTCILTMLGVDAKDIPLGRSYIEALALGIPVKADDIVLRCNFVKIAPDGTLQDPTCSAPEAVASRLKSAVSAIPGHSVTQIGSYKSLQVVSGGAGFLEEMETYPPHNYAGKPLESLLPGGNSLADLLAECTRAQLVQNAPYTVLNWAQSIKCELPSFSSLHGGMTGGMISATHAPVGCAVAMGMNCPAVAGTTGDVDTNLSEKAKAAVKLLDECDFVMLHIGGTDEATHRQNPVEKAEFVRKIDTELLAPVLRECAPGTKIMVTCDHVALCSTGGHTAEPVEFMLYEKGGSMSGNLGVLDGRRAVDAMSHQ